MVSAPRAVRVLLVDDDEVVRALARGYLELDGRFEVVGEGANGFDAVDIARREQPDLVLLDLEMPWLNGAEAVPGIRRQAAGAVIVLWTVAPESARAHEALGLGASVVMDKATYTGSLADELWHFVEQASIASSTTQRGDIEP